MAKYHINGDNEAKPCSAKKIKCRFGGESGVENHFESFAEAIEATARAEHAEDELISHSKMPKQSTKAVNEDDLNVVLNERSLKSVERMVEKGYEVNTSGKFSEIPTNSSETMFEISTIDIIDTPKYSNAVAALIAQNGMPFKKSE